MNKQNGEKEGLYSPKKGAAPEKRSKGSCHLAQNDSLSIETVKRGSSIHH
ncbi:hypothetical protein [Alkalihalobacillus trypoxylicola]|nr:hypothetical protein [Alkalihalobacillus trypoxylicola]